MCSSDLAYALGAALVLFEWDNETEAPEAASELTARAIEVLSNEYYETIINKDVKKLLNQLSEEKNLTDKERAILKDLKKQYESMEPIPPEEYQSYQGLIARAPSIWAKAKAADDYAMFAPTLKEIIDYQKKFIKYRLKAGKKKVHPYDLLLDDYEEGFTMKELDIFFERLKKEIVPLIQEVNAKKDKINKEYNYRNYPVEFQKTFNRKLRSEEHTSELQSP